MIGRRRSTDGQCALLGCRTGRTGAYSRAALRTTNIERTVRRLLVINLQTRRTLWTNDNHELLNHAEHRAGIRKGVRRHTIAAYEIFRSGHAFQRKQQVVLVGRKGEPVFERHDLRLDQAFDDRVEVLHAVEFSVTHRVEERLAFNFAHLDVLARARTRSQYLNCGHAAVAVRAWNQTLRNDVTERLGQPRANHGLFVLRIEADDAIDSLRRVD